MSLRTLCFSGIMMSCEERFMLTSMDQFEEV
jgi:hypothetical protein